MPPRWHESYSPKCLAYWLDPKDPEKLRHREYTGDDEYGNGCAGPSEGTCPICRPFSFLSE